MEFFAEESENALPTDGASEVSVGDVGKQEGGVGPCGWEMPECADWRWTSVILSDILLSGYIECDSGYILVMLYWMSWWVNLSVVALMTKGIYFPSSWGERSIYLAVFLLVLAVFSRSRWLVARPHTHRPISPWILNHLLLLLGCLPLSQPLLQKLKVLLKPKITVID